MAWTPKFTEGLFQKVQCNPRKEALRVALLSAKSEVEGAESLRDMPSLGSTKSGRTAFYAAGCVLLCRIDEANKTCIFTDIAI